MLQGKIVPLSTTGSQVMLYLLSMETNNNPSTETADMWLVSCTSKQSPGGFPVTCLRVSSSPSSQQFFISLIPSLTRASQPQELFWEGNFLSKMKNFDWYLFIQPSCGAPRWLRAAVA